MNAPRFVGLIIGALLFSPTASHAAETQPSAERGRIVRDTSQGLRVQDMTIEELNQRLAEFDAGKRNYRDGFIILNQLWFNYQANQMTNSSEFQEVSRRRKQLLEKHPELNSLQDVRLSEDIEASRRRENAKAAELQRLRAWMPQDNTPKGFFAHENQVAVKYQYRIEFFRFPDHISFFQADDSSWKMRDSRSPSAEPVQANIPKENPIKKLTFKNGVAVYPRNTQKNPPVRLLVCTRSHSYYAPTTPEERAAVRARGFEHGMPWKNPRGDRDDFCGIVDMSGTILYEFPSTSGQLLVPLDIVDRGTRAGVLIGKEVKEKSFEDGREILGVGKFHEMMIWEHQRTLRRVKLKDANAPDHVWYQKFVNREL